MYKKYMKKPVITVFAALIALVAGIAPVASTAHAQTYYPSTAYSSVSSCISLTAYQTIGSSDASTGGQVTELQQFLNHTGNLSGVSGYFDNGTYGAVINFQSAHGISPTGTVGPETRAAIAQVSCGSSSAYNPSTGYVVSPAQPIYPSGVPASSSNNTCYSTGSTYVCSYIPVSSVPTYSNTYPVSTPAYTNGYGYTNGYSNNGYVNNGYSNSNSCSYSYENGVYGYYCGINNNPVIASFSSSYSSTGVTITVTGYGFSSTNTVHFGPQTVTGVYSNGTTLTFTIPYTQEYLNGSYPVTVTNAQGITSNSLSFTMNSTQYYNPNGYNNGSSYNNGSYYNGNGYNSAPAVSNISGATSVNVGQTSTWSVNVSGNNSSYVTVHANWGDNNTSNNSDTQQGYGSQSLYSFSHTYTTPGNYTLTVSVTENGSTVNSTLNVNVSSNGYYYSY
jgi:peptidoglycan hydrolase-like protein with peptidoglycan-binding domain